MSKGKKKQRKNEKLWSLTHPLDFEKYRGEYIALTNSRIVAHGREFEKVQKEAMKFDNDPIFTKVPDNEIMIL